MDYTELAVTFFEEASEHLESIERILLEIDIDDPDSEELNAIFRAAHSIKGGAGTFGFECLQHTTHIFENILDGLRNGHMSLDSDTVALFLDTRDILKDQMECYKSGGTPDEDSAKETCDLLQEFYDTHVTGSTDVKDGESVEKPTYILNLRFSNVVARDYENLIEELKNFGDQEEIFASDDVKEVKLTTQDEPDVIEAVMYFILNPDQLEIEIIDKIEPKAVETVEKKLKKPKASSSKRATEANAESSTLRVPVEKVDQIINLVGELVITQSMLDQSVTNLGGSSDNDLVNGMELLKRNARDLQEAVMSIRMVPMDYVFSRFPRQIHDLAGKLNKEVELVTEGKSTELDKSLVEKIIDPLSHLVRNSLDHGIEKPDDREAKGKSRVGKLTLSAKHQGGSILIEVIDDGAGLNKAKLLEKAKTNGIPLPESMTDEDVWQLIFAPGFSTAEAVTDVSGRGVGMDVVKRNIQSLGGSVQILSKEGMGTTTRISLPLTMAILDGMSVKTGDEIYILPLGSVVESLQPNESDIHSMVGNEQLLRVRGEYLPIVYLSQVLDIPNSKGPATESIAVILQSEGKQYAMIIDDLLGQQQVVVKNLETNYKKIPGFSAATILGDGRVAFILDVAEILRLNKNNNKAIP